MPERHLHIPRLDLELPGVDADTARRVAELLPAALERALNPAPAAGRPPRAGSAQALAEQAAGRVVARLGGHLPRRGGQGGERS
ncbi:MAG TPA: hypothetical protein PLL19_01425 [Thiobacillaceae bacterium]|nr:hypothetical protein [Thiobacillaceae bacterium]